MRILGYGTSRYACAPMTDKGSGGSAPIFRPAIKLRNGGYLYYIAADRIVITCPSDASLHGFVDVKDHSGQRTVIASFDRSGPTITIEIVQSKRKPGKYFVRIDQSFVVNYVSFLMNEHGQVAAADPSQEVVETEAPPASSRLAAQVEVTFHRPDRWTLSVKIANRSEEPVIIERVYQWKHGQISNLGENISLEPRHTSKFNLISFNEALNLQGTPAKIRIKDPTTGAIIKEVDVPATQELSQTPQPTVSEPVRPTPPSLIRKERRAVESAERRPPAEKIKADTPRPSDSTGSDLLAFLRTNPIAQPGFGKRPRKR